MILDDQRGARTVLASLPLCPGDISPFLPGMLRQNLGGHHVSACEGDGTFDRALQVPDVAGIGVGAEQIERVRRAPFHRPVHLRQEPAKEAPHQQFQIVAPLSKRRNLE